MSAFVLPGHPANCSCGACAFQRSMRVSKQLTAIEQIVMALNEDETVFMSNAQLAQLHGYFKPSDALVISMQSDGWLVRKTGAPQR